MGEETSTKYISFVRLPGFLKRIRSGTDISWTKLALESMGVFPWT